MEYLVRPPRTLQSLAIESIGKWIALEGERISKMQRQNLERAEHLLFGQIEIIRKRLLITLPKKMHNLLALVLSTEIESIGKQGKKANKRRRNETSPRLPFGPSRATRRMIETTFTKNVTSLCLHIDPKLIDSLCSNSHLLTALQDLSLLHSDYWPYEADADQVANKEANLIRFLENLHDLRKFTIICYKSYHSIDNVLRCIADNCKLLDLLNLGYINNLSDDSFSILAELKKLRQFEAHCSIESEHGIATLLSCCHKIEDITIDDNEIALALELIDSHSREVFIAQQELHCEDNSEEYVGEQFNLKSYNNCRGETTLQQLVLLIEMCPRIENISLKVNPNEDIFADGDDLPISEDLLVLDNLENLRKLSLDGFDFYNDNIDELLPNIGCKLVELHLENVSDINLNALKCISQMCPNLESLSIKLCSFEQESVANDFFHKQESSQLKHLKTLSLVSDYTDTDSCLADCHVYFILSISPKVEFLSTCGILLTDELMFRVLDINPMIYMKTWKFYSRDRPTVLVIDRVIENCTNFVEMILVPEPDPESY